MNAEIIAWLGVLLGCLSLAWHVYTHISDRGALQVRALSVIPQGMTEGEIWCSATNVGRQPLFLKEAAIEYDRYTFGTTGPRDGLPVRLAPGAWHTVRFKTDQNRDGLPKGAWVRDSLGRTYRLSKKEAKKLRIAASYQAGSQ